ncbi:hypothetical protein ISU10_06915 [Nocardioides agariphilus]|jgi:hypothetical protein|uniref:Uncharacterized protein n=1 Tax=Nocardioides agariphilus TaxID=433664 RepID=A0A930VMR1_9ACTN|nr:hypothetical protein [Nocardioides agariphilus]MBF4767496.1 hypothetical protein [Nocardioides agariphilus]
MSTLVVMAAEHGETWGGVNHWVIGGLTLLILLAAMGVLIAFGGGREHS